MKKLYILFIIVFLIGSMGSITSNANAAKYTYTSGFQIQNLSESTAHMAIAYYDSQEEGGGLSTSVNVDLAGLGSATYFPVHASTGFKGSVVISSDQPVASIVNLVASNGGTHIGDASYIGSTTGATTVNLPLLHKNNYGFDSWFGVQNAGNTDATVTVSYSDGTLAGPVVIKPNATFSFDQVTETHPMKVFSATVTSDQPIIVVVNQEDSTRNTVQLYSGYDDGESNALMPLINVNNYGFITGVQIQNIGDEDADVTVTYTPAKDSIGNPIGTSCTETHRIVQGGSATYTLMPFVYGFTPSPTDSTTCILGERFVGSAQITGNEGVSSSDPQKVIAVVNQATSRSAGAYGSFLPSRTTAKVVLPLIMDRNYGWYSGFNLMNVGTGTVDVDCVFVGTTYTVSKTLAPGEALNDVQDGKIKDKYAGSGTCTATLSSGSSGTVKISAVVNEISPNANDNLLVYEGINIQ